jgi:putative adenylate-forming enzyme
MRWRTFLSHLLCAHWRWRRLHGQSLHEFQDQRAHEIVRFAVARAPFYHRHFAGHAVHDWQTLPTVDKALMMANFDDFNTLGIRREEAMAVALKAEENRDFRPTCRGVTVGLSSGTSGHRGLFLVSEEEQSAWAGFLLARTIPKFRLKGYSVAFFLRSNSNLYESLGSRWLRFRYHDLMTPLDQTIARLHAELPDFVVGPPSLLIMLADALQAGTLRIRPERLISVAEVLEPQDRDRLEQVFACPVHQIYQCTEGLLAISCAYGSLHLQEDLVAVQMEPLSEERFTPIVTDLWRRTQPIIRYRLNDVIRLDARACRCGSTFRVLAQIEGRCDDVLKFHTEGNEERIFFPDTIRRMILLSSPQILDYQAYQEKPGHLRVHLDIQANADFAAVCRSVRECVERTLAQYHCKRCDLAIERGLLPIAPGQKQRRVIRRN